MNSEQYLDYLQESQHITLESYKYIAEMYDSYMTSQLFDEYVREQRDNQIKNSKSVITLEESLKKNRRMG